MPRILIGIPTLNGPDRLKRALASVHAHTDLTDVSILVSDDGSTPENLEYNKNFVHEFGVPMLMSDKRLGIPKQWNRLVHHVPETEIVVLINDDIEVVPDWLDVLVFTLDKNPDIGFVSLRCETGVTQSNGSTRSKIDYHEARLLDGSGTLISGGGACFAFRRADWSTVGGFDERYFCFYEEIDFGVSLGWIGKHSVFAEYPVIYHMGGATIGTNMDANEVLLKSRQKFSEKWGKTLDELRTEFGSRARRSWIEWNSSWKYARLP